MFWFFFFNDTATTEIYTLSLHDALPICSSAETALILFCNLMAMPSLCGTLVEAELKAVIFVSPGRIRRPRVGCLGPLAVGPDLARMDVEQPFEGFLGGGDELGISPIGNIYEADVIVFAIHASGNGLVDAGEPARAEEAGKSRRLLDVVAVSHAALLLIADLHQAGAETVGRNAKVELADNDRTSGELVCGLDLPGRFILVGIQAVDIENARGLGYIVWRVSAERDTEVEVIGVVLLECRAHHRQILLEGRDDELAAALDHGSRLAVV